jgi:hypothetical protein
MLWDHLKTLIMLRLTMQPPCMCAGCQRGRRAIFTVPKSRIEPKRRSNVRASDRLGEVSQYLLPRPSITAPPRHAESSAGSCFGSHAPRALPAVG